MVSRPSELVARLLRGIAAVHSDLTMGERWLLVGLVVLRLAGIGWGLPASDGWDVDGVAPRDFLPGVLLTFSSGQYFTYPPLHLLLLTVLTLPVSLAALAVAPSLSQHDVVATFTRVPVMTAFACTARLVSVLMSLGIVLVIGRLAAAIFGPRARFWAMAIAGVDAAGTYYAHTTNLDVPALFWGSSALLALVLAVKADEPRRLRRVAILAACAIATKDQAYALFALSFPCILLAWAAERRRRGALTELLRETAYLVAMGVGLVLFIDGALVNPSGFAARVRFLTGPASQGFAQYPNDWLGRAAVLRDALTFLPQHYPVPVGALFALGLAFSLARTRTRARDRIAALAPCLAIVSFTLAFNCVARRVEERFMLPQMQLLAVYAGGAIACTLELAPIARRAALRWLVYGGAAACLVFGLRLSVGVVATMMGDARYDAEAYMREHFRPGDVVEVYSKNVYLPRFPPGVHVDRIGPEPPSSRNPMPGVEEKQDRFTAALARSPKWIVLSTGYTWQYLAESRDPKQAEGLPESTPVSSADADARTHIRALFEGRAGYDYAHVSHYAGHPWLPPRPLHASLACDIVVFVRR